MDDSNRRTTQVSRSSGPHYGYLILVLVSLSVFGSLGLARFGYTSILPHMQRSLRLDNAQAGQLQSWNLLGYLLTAVPAGVLAAHFGPRRVISAGLLVTAGALALTGLIPTFWGACLGRFLSGVGGAAGNVPAMGMLAAWFATRRRGMAAGIGVGGSSLGLVVTGPLVPVVMERFGPEGWRICWYLLGLMAAGVFALCALLLRNRPDELGLGQVGAPRNGGTNAAQAGGEELEVGFRAGWRMVYRSRQLWDLAVVYFAFGFSYIIYATFFIRYLVREGQMPGERAGMIWLTIGLASSASGCFWGWFSDRWGRKWALLSVFALHGSAYLLFGASLRPSAIYISAGLFAISAWSVPALMAALCGDIFGSRLAPAALGLVTIVFGIGQALGPYVAGLIADAAGSFSPAFLLACAMAGAGGVASLYLRPPVFIGPRS